jgi:hypothetical protein
MVSRFLAATLALAAVVTTPLVADNPHVTGGSYTVPVSGTMGPQNTPVNGTFTIKQFAVINNTLNALGTLNINNVVSSVAIPVAVSNPTNALSSANAVYANSNHNVPSAMAPAAVSCPILHLVLGPLNLNLLGLNVSLNQVVLDITAIPGAGNLLGNLLCDVANLLNPGGSLATLVDTLNQILGSL